MKSAHGPTGSPNPVALITGGSIHLSRHYLIAFAVPGVVYQQYAFTLFPSYTHEIREFTRGFVARRLRDCSSISSSAHVRTSTGSFARCRENAVKLGIFDFLVGALSVNEGLI